MSVDLTRRWMRLLPAIVALVLVVACGSVPAAARIHKPSPTPCPVAAAPGEWLRGCAILSQGGNLDLDGGQVNVASYDLAFAAGVLTVAPGTAAAYLGVLDFDGVTPQAIEEANLGTQPFPLGQLSKGSVLAVRTGQGRPAKVRFDRVSSTALDVSFFTYSSSASVSAPPPSHHTTPTPTPHHTPTPTPTPPDLSGSGSGSGH